MTRKLKTLIGIILLHIGVAATVHGQTYEIKVLHNFEGGQADGSAAFGGLVMDKSGNLYGTTHDGGTYSYGTVYKIEPAGKETVLHSFAGGTEDGRGPWAALIMDAPGNLYGTTESGGSTGCATPGCGTVFKIDNSGTETILHSFTSADGAVPLAPLIMDAAGNLFGTTQRGGTYGGGTVFRLDASGSETVLHSFNPSSGNGEADLHAGLVMDTAGNLYGTTAGNGSSCACGAVFKLDTSGNETLLHIFTGGNDGAIPYAGLVIDAAGNLYGTTIAGGTSNLGTVFKVDTSGNFTVLHSFTGLDGDGVGPTGTLIIGMDGTLYGTTQLGGSTTCSNSECGTVFKLDTSGRETILYDFTGGSDGATPVAGLVMDTSGNLYGATISGGTYGYGTVFELQVTGGGPSPVPPPYVGPAGTSTDPQATYAEPISTGNGNYFYQHTDFVIPGRGMPLVFQRSYNSLDNYTGPLGFNWTHSYNIILTDSGTSVTIKWGDGHGETFTLSAGVYAPQPGVFSTLVKNGDGTFTLTQKNQTRYLFSAAGKLASITDKNGNTITLSYDGNGNLVQVSEPSGRSLTLTYDASNRIILVTDPIGRTEVFSYSGADDLAQVTDPAGAATKFTYDANHRVSSITLPNNKILLENTYDGSGRVASQSNGRGFATTFEYDTPSSGQTTITDPRGKKTIHIYDSSLRITSIKDALDGTISYTYDSNNDRTAVSNQDGWATAFAYDAKGNITSLADALGNTAIFTYDSKNDLLTAKNPKGRTTTFAYDSNGNLHTIVDALGHTSTFAYNTFGELTSKTDANGHTTAYAYDSSGNLTRITDAVGDVTNLAYDGIGRLTSITDPNGHTAHAYYDALSRLIRIADPLGDQTRFEYDSVGNLQRIIDANGHATTYAYDATNNLVTVTDALGHVTRYTYDANNNRTTFTNANGNPTAYSYDALNRLTAVTDPLNDVTSYAYDPVGNVTAVTDANGKTNHFTYDQLNRLIGISDADGKSVNYAYDADGNRTSMVDSHGTTAYVYDALDRLVTVTNPGNTAVSYGYDSVGNRSSLTYPGGISVANSYDAANRLSRVTDWLGRTTSYRYDAASNLLSEAYPNGASVSFTYDEANRLLKVINTFQGSSGNPISSFTYLLDATGNRLQATAGSGKVTAYGYDALNQLTSVTAGTSVTTFTYDPVGNRQTLNGPGTSIQYSYDAADRLLAAGNTTFAYDANGNQITKTPPNSKPINFAYDAANHLVSVTGWKSASSFTYDGDGNRISQNAGYGTYTYLNDVATALPVVLQESGPDGNISYDYGPGLISEWGPGFSYFYQYDGLGSVAGLTDSRAKLAGRYVYDAWGQPDLSVPEPKLGTDNKFRFTGEALDPGTQLYFLRARYYDSSIGRFLTTDTFPGFASIPNTLHQYVYAINNPVLYTDPSGKFVWALAIGAGIGGVVGGINYWATADGNFSFWGLTKATAIGAATGAVATGAGLLAAAGLGAAGISGATAALMSGEVAGAAGQIFSNVISGKPIGENIYASTALGGITGIVAAEIPNLSSEGPTEVTAAKWNSGDFSLNSSRVLGQEFASDILSGAVSLLSSSRIISVSAIVPGGAPVLGSTTAVSGLPTVNGK